MGFQKPPSLSPLTPVTDLASFLNTYGRDNMEFLHHPAAVRARRTTNQSIPNDTFTVVNWNAADDFDTDDMHNPASNNHRIFINTVGLYVVMAGVRWASNNTGLRVVEVRWPGSDPAEQPRMLTYDLSSPFRQQAFGTPRDPLAVGDWLETWVYQFSGGSLNLEAGDGRASHHFAAIYLHG